MTPTLACTDIAPCTDIPGTTVDGRQTSPEPTRAPRLLLRPGGRSNVDGVWWPHTQNLTVELRDVATALAPRTGPVGRVLFRWDAVSTMQRHFDGDDGLDVGEPEADQADNVMRLYGLDGRSADLVVVRPGPDTHYGYDMMQQVSRRRTRYSRRNAAL